MIFLEPQTEGDRGIEEPQACRNQSENTKARPVPRSANHSLANLGTEMIAGDSNVWGTAQKSYPPFPVLFLVFNRNIEEAGLVWGLPRAVLPLWPRYTISLPSAFLYIDVLRYTEVRGREMP